ncbi:MAG: TatD family hydrolase, partial [Treponema sp.]|nr:TatD family hydrolase [Treponema sp.]
MNDKTCQPTSRPADSGAVPAKLIDIAVNLTAPAFEGRHADIIARAASAGVAAFILPGSSVADSEKVVELALRYDSCFATVGVHPHNASGWDSADGERLEELFLADNAGRIVAVGECGLDYNRNFSPQDEQRACFEEQLRLAAELGRPAFLHQRDAFADFLPILERYRHQLPGAVVHCFTGNLGELRAFLDLDCHIGITGWACDERRGTGLLPLLPLIPADRLLLETDSPYLIPRTLPKALRTKNGRNEPAFLPHVARFVAGILGKSLEELAPET